MGKRTGGKRGAPYGNSNRLKHGRWSKATLADDETVRALAQHLGRALQLTNILRDIDEDAEIGRRLIESLERRSAIGIGLDLEALGFEQHRHGGEDVAIVVDKGNVFAHGLASPDGAGSGLW